LLTSTSELGGTERTVLNFLTEASDQEWAFCVGSLIGSGLLLEKVQQQWGEICDLRELSIGEQVKRLVSVIEEKGIQLVQSFGTRADLVAWRAKANTTQLKLVFSIRSACEPLGWKRLFYWWSKRRVDLYLANSEKGKQWRSKKTGIPRKKIAVVYNGIQLPEQLEFNKAALRPKYKVPEAAKPVIGIIANLRIMKGHQSALRAIKLLRSKYPNITLLLAGRDELKGEVQRWIAQEGVEKNVRYLGFVDEVYDVLTMLDLFLLPSQWEGLPTSILEAMAARVPVIASEVGGIPEIINNGEDGLLIPRNTPAAIAQAVELLWENKKLQQMFREKGMAKVRSKFSLEAMTERWKEVLQAVIESKNGGE